MCLEVGSAAAYRPICSAHLGIAKDAQRLGSTQFQAGPQGASSAPENIANHGTLGTHSWDTKERTKHLRMIAI